MEVDEVLARHGIDGRVLGHGGEGWSLPQTRRPDSRG